MKLKEYLKSRKKMIDGALKRYIPPASTYPYEIHRAMNYCLFPGGKRLRPILTLASAESIGEKPQGFLPAACAIELIHNYSLVHDDLPPLDNDDYRRGKLTVHRKFGEAIAILTGNALLTLAFLLIAKNSKRRGIPAERVNRAVTEIAGAIGLSGMIAGQAVDIKKKKRCTKKEIKYIALHKTAALFIASVRVGAILAGANRRQLRNLSEYGEKIGFAFQIVDDFHDHELDKASPNYITCYGRESSLRKVMSLTEKAKQNLTIFGEKGAILGEISGEIARGFK